MTGGATVPWSSRRGLRLFVVSHTPRYERRCMPVPATTVVVGSEANAGYAMSNLEVVVTMLRPEAR